MEEAERATPHREARQKKSNGGASAAFAIRMEYKGEERSTKLPLGITRKDLFQLVLADAPQQLRVR
jgi:hypothetical protein